MKIDLQITEKVDGIFPLIAEIDFNIYTLEQIYGGLTPDELLAFDKYTLLQVLRHYLWNASILDLCKLFVENEKFSFQCLINILINNYRGVIFKNPLSREDLTKLSGKIKDFDVYIKMIKDVRDGRIAHKDPKSDYNAIMLYQLKTLVGLAKEIFNTLYEAFYDSSFIWTLKEDNRQMSLINNITKYERIEKLIFQAVISKKKEIQTSDLYKIILNN